MPRPFLTVSVVLIATQAMGASQAADMFRVSKASVTDVQQDTLQAINPQSKQTTEVFPGNYQSASGAAVIARIQALMDRVDEADRNELIENKATAGFDRAIVTWRAQPDGQKVALAVRYYRDPLFRLDLQMTDDYGRADPVDPSRYELFAIAVCSRAGAAWSCGEELLTDVAGRYKMPLPQTRPDRIAAAEKLVEVVLAGK